MTRPMDETHKVRTSEQPSPSLSLESVRDSSRAATDKQTAPFRQPWQWCYFACYRLYAITIKSEQSERMRALFEYLNDRSAFQAFSHCTFRFANAKSCTNSINLQAAVATNFPTNQPNIFGESANLSNESFSC